MIRTVKVFAVLTVITYGSFAALTQAEVAAGEDPPIWVVLAGLMFAFGCIGTLICLLILFEDFRRLEHTPAAWVVSVVVTGTLPPVAVLAYWWIYLRGEQPRFEEEQTTAAAAT